MNRYLQKHVSTYHRLTQMLRSIEGDVWACVGVCVLALLRAI